MAFFFLNRLSASVDIKQLKSDLAQFGKIKFVGDLRDDTRNKGFKSTVVDFRTFEKKSDFDEYCKKNKIFATERKEKHSPVSSQKSHSAHKDTQNQNHTPKIDIANPSFHFYKDKAYGKNIETYSLTNNYQELFTIGGAKSFELKTIYPGLLVGSGYNLPKLKESSDDFQLGFFFDHTTGLPLISGSSIKGLLKSVCKKDEFIQAVYETSVDMKVFDDNQSIFYDAFILRTDNHGKKIFGSDFITSHHSQEKNGLFKEPNPVKFLKVLPDVTFKFQFECDVEYIELFQKIILDFGLGAKTNVGYGKFVEA